MNYAQIRVLAQTGEYDLQVHQYCDRCCELCVNARVCLNYKMQQHQFGLPDVEVEANKVFWKHLHDLVDDFSQAVVAFSSEVGFDVTSEIRDNIDEPFENHRILNKFNDYVKSAGEVLGLQEVFWGEKNAQLSNKVSSLFSKKNAVDDSEIAAYVAYVLHLYAEKFPSVVVRALHNRLFVHDDRLFMDSVMTAKTVLEMLDRMMYCWSIFYFVFNEKKYEILTVCIELAWIYYNLNNMFEGVASVKRPGID